MTLLAILIFLPILAIALAISTLALLSLAALLPPPRLHLDLSIPRPPAAILIPAHNEAAVLAATLAAITPQLLPQDRLIVIADNCADATASLARSVAATFPITVLERSHASDRGKGFALAHGVDSLRDSPPQILLMIDADCHAHPGSIDALIRTAHAVNRPAQAVYIMATPPAPTVKDHLSAFAFLTKNLVRPRGLARLGCPILLTGTGMAFPWSAIASIPLASSNIVEDMQLGIDLALQKNPPLLCSTALVTGQLPTGQTSAHTQRKRWEHGHLRTLLTQAPRLLFAGLLRPRLLPLAADLLIPPLALLAALWSALALIVALLSIYDHSLLLPAILHAASGLLFLATITLIWARFARPTIPLRALLSVPFYILWKIPMYLHFLTRPEKSWIRTPRTPEKP